MQRIQYLEKGPKARRGS
uniref:Uncharacterized protein n=1 Tax=Rhizophora mucronata TaxID=61149 RepID=A0A2P2NSN0_RHIMU